MNKHLFFVIAGHRYALSHEYVKAVHSQLSLSPVVGTCHWFLGLATFQGRLIPVTNLGSFCGLAPSEGSTVELDPSIALAALKVDGVFLSSSEPQTRVAEKTEHGASRKLPALPDNSGGTSSVLREFVTGELVSDKGQTYHVLDVSSLVQSDRFINIKESFD